MNEIKKQLLLDWDEYCQGNTSIDKSHFYTLLHADPLLTKEQLDKIFSSFPNNDQFTKKILDIYKVLYSKENSNNISFEFLVSNAKCDLREKARISKESNFNSLSNQKIEELIPKIIHDKDKFNKELFNSDNPSNILEDYFDDAISSLKDARKFPMIYGLKEAIYGLTSDNSIVTYVIEPLLVGSIDLECYFNLWKNKARYIATNEELLIYIK